MSSRIIILMLVLITIAEMTQAAPLTEDSIKAVAQAPKGRRRRDAADEPGAAGPAPPAKGPTKRQFEFLGHH